MSAYMIVQAEITDPEKFPEYQKLAAPAVQKYNGKFLGRGAPDTVEGQWSAPVVVILEFESAWTGPGACWREFALGLRMPRKRAS